MPPDLPLGPLILSLLLALLVALLATLGAARRKLAPSRAMLFGGIILVGELGVFATLALVGLPATFAGLAALAFGLPFTLTQRSPEEEAARIQASTWWRL